MSGTSTNATEGSGDNSLIVLKIYLNFFYIINSVKLIGYFKDLNNYQLSAPDAVMFLSIFSHLQYQFKYGNVLALEISQKVTFTCVLNFVCTLYIFEESLLISFGSISNIFLIKCVWLPISACSPVQGRKDYRCIPSFK